MKSISFHALAVLLATALMFSCAGNDKSSDDNGTDDALTVDPNVTAPAPNTAVAGVLHYICPNNCEGSGGDAAGTCPVCGAAYVHNAEFHNQTNATPPPAADPNQTIDLNNVDPNQPIQLNTQQPTNPAPAQNAAGVWHYTCANGCEGGAGAQGTCSKCGGQLVHNQAYHQ